MRKYGEEHFHFEVIEETDKPEEREMYYINLYKSYVGFKNSNGYNATLGGDGKSYLNLIDKDVICYYVKNAEKQVTKTAKYFNVSPLTIKKILKRNNIEWLSNKEAQNKEFYSKHGGIMQIDSNTHEIVNIFKSISDANKYFNKNINNGNIFDALSGRRKSRKAYGYYWCYGKNLEKFLLHI